MSDLGDKILRNQDNSETKSYIIGLERGRVWASDYADYFTMREYSELDVEELLHFDLPNDEDRHFRLLSTESPLELRAYLRGWVAGVREVVKRY
jgi:hypothetical protein